MIVKLLSKLIRPWQSSSAHTQEAEEFTKETHNVNLVLADNTSINTDVILINWNILLTADNTPKYENQLMENEIHTYT